MACIPSIDFPCYLVICLFRGYDVRGLYGSEVTEEKFTALGRAYYSFSKRLIVGMDFRKPNPSLFKAFCDGFGGEVSFAGHCPTACISFNGKDYGLQITASHNPPQYAGAKFIHNHHGFFEAELEKLKKKFESELQKPSPSQNGAEVETDQSLLQAYIDDIPPIEKGIFDLGGGAACSVSKIFPQTLFSEPDPLFERRAPEPTDEALTELKKKSLAQKQLGFAFDGDADRVMVAAGGKLMAAPHVTAFLCAQNFKKNDRVVLNIEFSHESREFIEDELGMKVTICPVGTKHVVTNVLEHKAVLGAEPNGHYYIPRHVPDSDGIYSAALLSAATPKEMIDFCSQFKNTVLSDAVKVKADFKKLEELARERGAQEIETMDGVRAVYEDYVVLMRASNTEPKVRVTVESSTPKAAQKGMEASKQLVLRCAIG